HFEQLLRCCLGIVHSNFGHRPVCVSLPDQVPLFVFSPYEHQTPVNNGVELQLVLRRNEWASDLVHILVDLQRSGTNRLNDKYVCTERLRLRFVHLGNLLAVSCRKRVLTNESPMIIEDVDSQSAEARARKSGSNLNEEAKRRIVEHVE